VDFRRPLIPNFVVVLELVDAEELVIAGISRYTVIAFHSWLKQLTFVTGMF
jgi:hypothetical protein